MSDLAILGGPKAVTVDPGDALNWPTITQEDEDAVLERAETAAAELVERV